MQPRESIAHRAQSTFSKDDGQVTKKKCTCPKIWKMFHFLMMKEINMETKIESF